MTANTEKKAITMKKLNFSGSKAPRGFFLDGNLRILPLGNFIVSQSVDGDLTLEE